MIRLDGKIVDADAKFLTIRVPYHPDYVSKDMNKATVFLHDGRKHSRDQHGKVFALIGEIAMWAGYRASDSSEVNADMKRDFLLKRFDDLSAAAIKSFSMSDGDVTTVSLYISHLIDFILEHNIPTKRPLTEMCEDIQQAVYSALIHKRCIVCGGKAELHHVDRIGMGNNRNQVHHIGRKALPLCRTHHQEIDHRGDRAFCELYHVEPVEIDKKISQIYRLRGQDA